MNTVSLVGRLGKDPVETQTATGKTVTKFSLAVDRGRKDGNGERVTDWFNCVCWERTAEIASRYLAKGAQAAVTGRIEFRSYDDKDGVRRDTHDVVVASLTLVGSREDGGGRAADPSPAAPSRPVVAEADYDPFTDE